MKLRLVKQGDFLGTKCDFYVDEESNNIYMSRTQIGYALQYTNPSHAILVMHQRHKDRMDKFSVEVRSSHFVTPYNGIGKDKKAFMYTEQGVYAICGYSNKEIAERFNDWVYETVIMIRKNGYYIATEKDEKWLGIRKETKQVRRMETDTIKKFVAYAESQGSEHAGRYYQLFTDLVHKRLGIEAGSRDEQSQETLLRLKSLETIVDMHICTLMNQNIPYKEVFTGVKELIKSI